MDDVQQTREDNPLALLNLGIDIGPQEIPHQTVLDGAVGFGLGDQGELVQSDFVGLESMGEVGPRRLLGCPTL